MAGSTGNLYLSGRHALLAEHLSGRASRANFRTGTLTVCTMVPMRSVPHEAVVVLGLDDLLNRSVDGSGYNAQYGLLGSNKADDDRVKLFPRDAKAVAEDIGKAMSDATGKRVEAMVYGDGAQGVATYIEKIGSELRDNAVLL